MKLGKLEKIEDLRSVWKNEANDFTPWLAKEENLRLLSDTIGIDISLEERESPVGGFSVDLYATEEGTGRKIIIENQLEETNHDHLGKLITYASGKNADVVIWIVRYARDEHKQAIEWLNQHTDDEIAFFLVEIELWRIDNSEPAVKFSVVERPNDWARAMKRSVNLTETANLQLEFWTEFNEMSQSHQDFTKVFKTRTARPQNWYDLSVGSSSYHVNLTVSPQKKQLTAGLYIEDDKELFKRLKEKETELIDILGDKIEWSDAKKASRLFVTRSFDAKNHNEWNKGFEWLYDMCLKIKKSLSVL